jgi:hypothetical protein
MAFGGVATAEAFGDTDAAGGCLADEAPAELFLSATVGAAVTFAADLGTGFLATTGLVDFLTGAAFGSDRGDRAVDLPAAELLGRLAEPAADLAADVPTGLPVDFDAGLAAGLEGVVGLPLGAGAAGLRAGAGAGLALALEAAFADGAAGLPATLRAADFATVGAFAAGFFTFACSLVLLG